MTINEEEIDMFADTDVYTNKKTLIITHVSFRNLNVTLKLCSDFLIYQRLQSKVTDYNMNYFPNPNVL